MLGLRVEGCGGLLVGFLGGRYMVAFFYLLIIAEGK